MTHHGLLFRRIAFVCSISVFERVCIGERPGEGLVHVEVRPLFRGSLRSHLKLMIFFCFLDCVKGHCIFNLVLKVRLSQNDSNRFVGLNLLNFCLPARDIVEGLRLVARDANHEDVSILILHLSINAEVLVTRRVMNLKLDLLPTYILDAYVDVEDGRFVIVIVSIV